MQLKLSRLCILTCAAKFKNYRQPENSSLIFKEFKRLIYFVKFSKCLHKRISIDFLKLLKPDKILKTNICCSIYFDNELKIPNVLIDIREMYKI